MNNKQKILGVNTKFESLKIKNFDEYHFKSAVSFLDYDAVIINATSLTELYRSDRQYQNKRLLRECASMEIKNEFTRIRDQIKELLKQGKNVYVLMGKNEDCSIYTGEKQYSGTGKNTRTTNIVQDFDAFSFLPIKISATHVYGEKFENCSKQPYFDFFKKTEECFGYDAFFDADSKNTLLKIPKTNKAISAVYEIFQGKVILLPMPYFEDDYTDVKYWKKNGKIYLEQLFHLNERLSVFDDDYSLPEWAENILILNEKEELQKLSKEVEKLHKIERAIEKQKKVIYSTQQYKTLLTASGDRLEEIVKKVMVELGFVLLNAERGRSDIIAEFGSFKVVIEIKGVTKSAAEKHAAQLEKWAAQFIEENGKIPKAILIVNGYCDTPLQNRKEEVFPHQMLKYSESRNHCLMTTTQLLCLFIEVKNNPSCLNDRIEELLQTTGKYNRYLLPQKHIEIK